MSYVVEYYRDGRSIGKSPWDRSLEETKQFARDGLIRHQADFVRIIDVDGSGAEIWSERRDAK